MRVLLAPPSKNAGTWMYYPVGCNLTGARFTAIAFESGEEIEECVRHPEWFAKLRYGFYPKNPFRPTRITEEPKPLEYRDDMNH